MRDANYLLTAEGPLTLNRKWRRRWEGIKKYVNAYIIEEEKKLKNARYREFMVALRNEISGDMLYSYVPLARVQVKSARPEINRAFADAHSRGDLWNWLDKADRNGPGPDITFTKGSDGIQRFLECVVHNVYKREFACRR